uniref:SLX4 interacting protein n=1 Tax=Seriola lalandi dorsalis TaxID=1841481 RepID=A0A3B4YWG0_SERLL
TVPSKTDLVCGNFAVLVDLHVLPLGGQEDASWFTTGHIEEVTALVRDAVDQRVKQYTESLHNRRQLKQKKDLAPMMTAVCCGSKPLHWMPGIIFFVYTDSVCPLQTELSELSRSEYFSRVGETQEALNSPTKTKKTVLQKIPTSQRGHSSICSYPLLLLTFSEPNKLVSSNSSVVPVWGSSKLTREPVPKTKEGNLKLNQPQQSPVLDRSPPQRQTTRCLVPHDLLPPPPLPPVEAKAESKAFPVSKCKKTTLEVELLTPGKRAQRLPLTSNNTAQTNQNRLAASLRGLSVNPASSGSSISSRSTLGEEGRENVPRTSRLRRLKRS